MKLLNGRSLKVKDRFTPEAMSLNWEERNSTASLTLGPEAPALTVGDWVQDETEPGKGIVWRVKTVTESVETRTRTVALEHVIQALKDRVLFGEHTPATITGDKKKGSCTAKAAITYILQGQKDWKLGDIERNPTNPYTFNGDNLYSALETVTGSLDTVQWEYDFTAYPFTLHIRKQPTAFSCEMRMSRNITTLRRQIDRSRMYTRIYPIGKNNLHITGNYLSKNESVYGVICKVETDQSQDTEAKLKAWAQERLDRHCEPLVTDTVTGLDLSAATGEPLDRIRVGLRCRMPLPDYGTALTERVVKTSWSDKIKEPEKFTVTMANQQEDVASIVNSLIKSGGGGGRAAAKNAEEDHAWFVDTTDHVAMVAEAVAGEGASKDWSRVSQILVDGEGIHQRVTAAEGKMVTYSTLIEQNEKRIGLVVEVGKDGKGKIRAGEIALAINNGGSEAMIKATQIKLLGNTIAQKITADYIGTKIASLASVSVQSLTSARGGISVYSVATTTFKQAGVTCYLPNAISGLQIVQNGNNYTLQRQRFNDDGWTDVGTFSRAVTDWGYSWSGGQLTVTAYPQGSSKAIIGVKTAGSWSGRTYNGRVVYWDGTDDDGPTYNTGATFSLSYTAEKSDIMATRSNRYTSDPTHDSVLTTVTQNGYYLVTVTACGATRTYRIYVNVA